MTKKQYRTLPLLPGGGDNYLSTIEKMLNFLDDEVRLTRDEFTDWVVDEYGTARTSVNSYIQTLSRTLLIERKAHNRLGLTPKGKEFLNSYNPENRALLILNSLIPQYYGFVTMLEVLAQVSSFSLDELEGELRVQYALDTNADIVSKQIYWAIALVLHPINKLV